MTSLPRLFLAALASLWMAGAGSARAASVTAAYRDFSGGLVDSVEPLFLQPNQSPALLNVLLDEALGALKPRSGYVQCGSLPSGNLVTGLYEFSKSDGTRRLIATDNQNYYQTADCVTWTTIKTGLSSTARPSFVTVRDKLWVMTRSTWAFTWDGTTTKLLDGTAGTSSPSLCAYAEFWHEIVWCARTAANPSTVYFSDITDTAGNDIDPSTSSVAFPATNAFDIDENGGSPIYGIKAFRDRLYVFKGNGIWQIDFNSKFDNRVVKTLATAGARFNTSIVELDNLLYYVGIDGIYAFDGNNSVRISDPIRQTFDGLSQPLANEAFKTWTSQSDFQAGTFTSSTTANASGQVTILASSSLVPNGGLETGTTAQWAVVYIPTTPAGAFIGVGASYAISGSYGAQMESPCTGGDDFGRFVRLYFIDLAGSTATYISDARCPSDNVQCSKAYDLSAYAGQTLRAKFSAWCGSNGGHNETQVDFWTSSFSVVSNSSFTFDAVNFSWAGDHQFGWRKLDNVRYSIFSTSGVYTSEIYNFVSVSSWTTFDATTEANGGAVQYGVRVGSDTSSVLQTPFSNISPGSIISGTTAQIYAQWRATITAPSGGTGAPAIDDVTITVTQGDISNSPIFGLNWKNRYWISAASGASSSNNIQLVKSKKPSDAFTVFDLPIAAMTRYNDLFYAGSSTGPAVFRMDYGTSDSGRAIGWYWQSRDEDWQRPHQRKRLMELAATVRRGCANLKLGFSSDSGSTFTDRTVNLSGTGLGSTRQFVSGGNALYYRLRVRDTTLDESCNILSLEGTALPQGLRE